MAAGAVAFIGQFTAWTYITPFLMEHTHLSSGVLPAVRHLRLWWHRRLTRRRIAVQAPGDRQLRRGGGRGWPRCSSGWRARALYPGWLACCSCCGACSGESWTRERWSLDTRRGPGNPGGRVGGECDEPSDSPGRRVWPRSDPCFVDNLAHGIPHGGLHRPCRCRALRGGGAVRNTRKEGMRRPERSGVAGRSEPRAPSALVGAALAVPTRIGDFTYGATLSLIIRGRAVVSWVKKRRGRRPQPAKRQRFVELRERE